jgi:hypothetical protein
MFNLKTLNLFSNLAASYGKIHCIRKKIQAAEFLNCGRAGAYHHYLKNAIKNNQLAHAFLFCGPRGVVKQPAQEFWPKPLTAKMWERMAKPVMNAIPVFHLTTVFHLIYMNLMRQ